MVDAALDSAEAARAVPIDVVRVSRSASGGAPILQDVSLSVRPGEVVAVVGGSGAGKTTLLETLAGVQPPDRGVVRYGGNDQYENASALRGVIGLVPQDDIIHTDLPLLRTLRYAARLRLPPETTRESLGELVDGVLASLDLTSRAEVRVGDLSGGQRKRASIAVELLTEPAVFFLDEPTSGLDPATSKELLRVVAGLAKRGTTVVFTTHSIQDLAAADRVVFLARGGRLAFAGTVTEARSHFAVDAIEDVYAALTDEAYLAVDEAPQGEIAERAAGPHARGTALGRPDARRPGALRQWRVLSARTLETLARNRLTMAILVGSPVLIVAMFAVLFRPGAFDRSDPSPSTIVMIVFWLTFAAFFFGLTYGLLQICTERSILRREHLAGLRLGSYLLSKATVLLPFLIAVVALMLVVLRVLHRLPSASTATYLSIAVTLTLTAAGGLTLGLLTSAAVKDTSQATLALPMLCFPAVLFSGAILPVHIMAGVGAAISLLVTDRWAFEAVGRALDVRDLLQHGGSPLGPPLVTSYGDAGTSPILVYWSILAGFAVAFLALAWLVLRRRSIYRRP
jgi:ABC-type multidrug transport system ATPase subunit/ABC-type multidrug transport system permease subunit